MRGGGTGVGTSPLGPASFLVVFFTIFFFGASAVGVLGVEGVVGVVGVVGVAGSAFSAIDDSICDAVVAFPFGLTPICSRDTGGVGTSGSSTESFLSSFGGGGEAGSAAGEGEVTVADSSLAMMACASAAASSTSLSGVGSGSAAAGGLSCNLPARLRRSSATIPTFPPLFSFD